MENPFTPSFGIVPAHMAGRKELIAELSAALDNGAGDPNLTTIVSGARGTGKTALLSHLSDIASSKGWVAINVSAMPGMLEEIVQQAQRSAAHLLSPQSRIRVSGVKVGDVAEVEFQHSESVSPTWRIRMSEIFDELARTETGLFITVDEVREDLDEMIQLASAFQHFVREGRQTGLLMAGLPSHISALLQDKSVSFLRRANYYELGAIDDFEVCQALRKTVEEAGRKIESQALTAAVKLSGGFPYMMQLVGYRAWNASPENETLTLGDVREAEAYARNDMRRKIFDATFRELSKGDVHFLEAMLPDEGSSEISIIAKRMGRKSNYASQYKRRLIEQGVLIDCGQGRVRIQIPLFKDYLRERSSQDDL